MVGGTVVGGCVPGGVVTGGIVPVGGWLGANEGMTVSVNEVVADSGPPSETIILISALPFCPLAGVMTRDRREPLPVMEMFPSGTSRVFEDDAFSTKLAVGVSASSIVNEIAGEGLSDSMT